MALFALDLMYCMPLFTREGAISSCILRGRPEMKLYFWGIGEGVRNDGIFLGEGEVQVIK